MTPADRLLLVALVALAVLAVPITRLAAGSSAGTAIVRGPDGRSVIELSENATYRVQGRDGEVVLRAVAGAVRVDSSTCADKLCVRSGALMAGRPIVCAPNGVTVVFGRVRGGEVDAVSR